MDNEIKITKSLLGAQHVSYHCPKCGDDLRSPLTEAGRPDTCPNCNARFVVPGAEYLRQLQEQKQAKVRQEQEAAERRHEEKLRKQQKEAELARSEAERRQAAKLKEQQEAAVAAQSPSPPSAPLTSDAPATGSPLLERLRGHRFGVSIALTFAAVVLPAAIFGLMHSSKPSVPEMFKTQLMKFIEEGTKTCERSGQGVNYLELREQLASVKAAYSLCKATWPKSLRQEMTAEFDRSIAAWDLTLDIWKDKIDRPSRDGDEVFASEFNLGQFEDVLSFREEFVTITTDGFVAFKTADGKITGSFSLASLSKAEREHYSTLCPYTIKYLRREASIRILLSIASDSFTEGRDKTLVELQ